MPASQTTPSADSDLKRLERWVEELIRLCEQLKHENRELRSQCHALSTERDNLLQKTKAAHARVETMLDRLRTIEQGP